MSATTHTCVACGTSFDVAPAVLSRYPGWTPSRCRDCHGGSKQGSGARAGQTRMAVTAGGDDCPPTGLFTDGSCHPNPGPGGWAAVLVQDDVVVAEVSGYDPDTTNNRMELMALLRGIELIEPGVPMVVYSDSNLAVRTVNEWAAGWQQRGWKRKTGPIQNLDLVKDVYAAFQARPELELRWIKAHVGLRWNEAADELATAARLR